LTALVFHSWIVGATYTTMVELKTIQQVFKFERYKKLVILILTCLALSILLGIAQVIVEATGVQDDYFKYWWIWEMYWQLVYVVAVIAISIIWRPSENNALYAHSEQLPQSDGSVTDNEGKEDTGNDIIELEETSKDTDVALSEDGGKSKKSANLGSDSDSYSSTSL